MHFNSKLILLVAATLPSTLAAVNGRCSGRSGICIATGTCSNYGGTYYSGKCPNDANNIRCCDNIPCRADDGRSGNCIFADQCSGDKISGKCPGGSDFKCCVGKKQENYAGRACKGVEGTCIDVNSQGCGTETVTGKCDGPANIKCCLAKLKGVGEACKGVAGTCIDVNRTSCPYTTLTGKCNGPSSVKCCPNNEQGVGEACKGVAGTCIDVNRTSCPYTTLTGKCNGPVNVKCCPNNEQGVGEACKGVAGTCIDVNRTNCPYTTLTGKCNGPANVKCCPNNEQGVGEACKGVAGTCIDVNRTNCPYTTLTGKCNGPANVKCCPDKEQGVGEPCQGVDGICIDVNRTSCPYTPLSGKCNGPANVKCCPNKSTEPGVGQACKTIAGTCLDSTVSPCATGFVKGECPGSKDVLCCPTKSTEPGVGQACKNIAGTCLDSTVSPCATGFVKGECPGSKDVLCCPNSAGSNTNPANPEDFPCLVLGGQCMNKNSCNGKVQTGLCSGGSDRKCCLPPGTTCEGVGGQCTDPDICRNLGGGVVRRSIEGGGIILDGLCPGDNRNKCCVPLSSIGNGNGTPGDNIGDISIIPISTGGSTPSKIEDRIKHIYSYMKKHGGTDSAIAGMLGVWAIESTIDPKIAEGYNSGKIESGGTYDGCWDDRKWIDVGNNNWKELGFKEKVSVGTERTIKRGLGLAQWTDTTDGSIRHSLLVEYAYKERKKVWYDFDVQLDFMFEHDDKEYIDFLNNEYLKFHYTPDEAAKVFLNRYENGGTNKLCCRQYDALEIMMFIKKGFKGTVNLRMYGECTPPPELKTKEEKERFYDKLCEDKDIKKKEYLELLNEAVYNSKNI